MRILVTGSRGFIGKNLVVRLGELPDFDVLRFDRGDELDELPRKVAESDAVVHLAGENRPEDPVEFETGNVALTRELCNSVKATGRRIPLLFTSSAQAEQDNPYGVSKRAAEAEIESLFEETGNPAVIYRLPGVFGKWCKPGYNSVVATFCHNIANGLPITIVDPKARLRLVYVDDVIREFLSVLTSAGAGVRRGDVKPEYSITVGELATQIEAFKECRTSLLTERVGGGLVRALYSTFVSYLPTEKFVYELPRHEDERGVFVEFLKTRDSGQFSFFTAAPGVTRGGHYHHSKTEKFLVVKGEARFRFRNVLTDETHQVFTSAEVSRVVETVPGWTHDISNVGQDEMIVMLWANEIFDREHPDTVAQKVE